MSLEQDIRILAQTPILGAFSAEALRLIAFSSRKQRLRAGERLHDPGETLGGAAILLEGSLELTASSGATHSLHAPAAIGELALFTPVEAGAGAIAGGDIVVMRIARETMERVLEEFPQEAEAARDRIAAQIEALARELESAAGRALRS